MSEIKMRRKVTSKEKPFTGKLTLFTWKEGTHLVIVIFFTIFKKNFKMNFFRVYARYIVLDFYFLVS